MVHNIGKIDSPTGYLKRINGLTGSHVDIYTYALTFKVKESMTPMWFDGDSNPSIALSWIGEDGQTLLAVTTYEGIIHCSLVSAKNRRDWIWIPKSRNSGKHVFLG